MGDWSGVEVVDMGVKVMGRSRSVKLVRFSVRDVCLLICLRNLLLTRLAPYFSSPKAHLLLEMRVWRRGHTFRWRNRGRSGMLPIYPSVDILESNAVHTCYHPFSH